MRNPDPRRDRHRARGWWFRTTGVTIAGMGWISDRLAVVKAAWQERRYVLPSLIVAVAGVSGLLIALLQAQGLDLSGLLPYLVGLFIASLLGGFWIIEYAVKLRKQIRGTRVGLSVLRQEGVVIRNDGRRAFRDKSSWTEWEKRAKDWNLRVIEKIKEVNEADAIWYETLDVVPLPRLNFAKTSAREFWEDEQERLYGWHDFRLKRLGEMIQSLWRD